MEEKTRTLICQDGVAKYTPRFLDHDKATVFFHLLLDELPWREESIVVYGKRVVVPRLTCWFGDPGVAYRYSGVDHVAEPWTATLSELRRRVEKFSDHQFNGVLGNLYRDGRDGMGWHADNEKELGVDPVIASLSLGEARRFSLQHNKTRERIDVDLEHGSLLVMRGELQHHWRHAVPKTRKNVGQRINLTFRAVIAC